MNLSDYFTRFLGILTSELFTKLVGVVGGILGTALGIYNLIVARQKEKHSRRGQEEDWQKYIGLVKNMTENRANTFSPEIGSDDHRWAERMVEKGLLCRGQGSNTYTLPKASFP